MAIKPNEEVDEKAEELAATLEFKAVPLKKNKFKIARFLIVLEATNNATKALKYAEIAHKTAYNWRKKYPGFRALWEQAIQARVDRALEIVVIVAELYDESPQAALKAALAQLKVYKPELWGDKAKLTVEKTFKVKW